MNNDSIDALSSKQKAKEVLDAYVIASSGDQKPNQESLNIAKQYIDGKIELEEMKSKIISLYKKGGDV